MSHRALLFLASILAGFALANLPVALFTGSTALFTTIGTIVIIVFSTALLYLGIRSLFSK